MTTPTVVCLQGYCGSEDGGAGNGGSTGSAGGSPNTTSTTTSGGEGGNATTSTATSSSTGGAGGSGNGGASGAGGVPGTGGDATTTTTSGGSGGAGGMGGAGNGGAGGQAGATGVGGVAGAAGANGAGGTGGTFASGGGGTGGTSGAGGALTGAGGTGGSVAVGGGDPADAGVPIDPDAGTPPADDAGDGSVPANPDAGTDAGGPPVCQPPVAQPVTCSGWIAHADANLAALSVVSSGVAIAPNEAYVAGGMNAGKIVRFDGSAFIPQALSPIPFSIKTVDMLDGHLLAFGRGPKFGYDCIVLEKTGQDSWTKVLGTPSVGSSGGCVHGWGTSADMFLLALTGTGDTAVYRGPLHGPWVQMTIPALPMKTRPERIWGIGNMVYVVGRKIDAQSNDAGGMFLVYDSNVGNQWISIQVDPQVAEILAVNGSDSCDVTLGGRSFGSPAMGVMISFDGAMLSAPSFQPEVSTIFQIAKTASGGLLAVGGLDGFVQTWIGTESVAQDFQWSDPMSPLSYHPRGIVRIAGSDVTLVLADEAVLSGACN